MKTYNGIIVPKKIKPTLIISAFANDMDSGKVEHYTNVMRVEMLSHSFPPIEGFPTIIDESDVGDFFLTGEEIEECHIGILAWKVTDGHHRAKSAICAKLPYIETELDYSTITNEVDMKNFKDAMK